MDFKTLFRRLKESIVPGSDEEQQGFEDPATSGAPLPPMEPPPPSRDSVQAPFSASPASSRGGEAPFAAKAPSTPAPKPSDPNAVAGLGNKSEVPKGKGKGVGPAIVQVDQDDSSYLRRSEQVQIIQDLFADFGPRVSSYLLTQSLSEGGIGRIALKLGLEAKGQDRAKIALIEKWIRKHGVEEFGKAVGLRLAGSSGVPPAPPSTGSSSPELKVRVYDPNNPDSPNSGSHGPSTPKFIVQGRKNQSSESTPVPPPVPFGVDPPSSSGPRHVQQVSVQPIGLEGKEIQRAAHKPANSPPPKKDDK